jgi:GNAT superfamily N-acetyltransferase
VTTHYIVPCTRADFDAIVSNHATYWDSELTLQLHHPMFFEEFGDTAFVIRADDTIAAYLFGFFAQKAPVAYVHMVAVHPAHRRQGLARALYEHFIEVARARDCKALKATASPMNGGSIRFHTALGMQMLGEPVSPEERAPGLREVRAVRGYLKPGVDRVVFHKSI